MFTGEKRGKRARGIRLTWLLILAGILILAGPAGAAFIDIDDIGDKGVGDQFTITASTDLPVGTQVLVDVYSSSFSPTQKTQSGEFSGASGSTVVIFGGGQLNRISFDVDTSTFKPDQYVVTMQAIRLDATGNALFSVVEKVQVPYFVTINTIGDRYVGERFTITATTNLPPGVEILFTVAPTPFSVADRNKGGESSGLKGTTVVFPGTGGLNTLSFIVDTSSSRSGEHVVFLEAPRLDASWQALFNVRDIERTFITLDPIGNRYVGDVFTITATTNLQPGEEVHLTITSPYYSEMRSGFVTQEGRGVNRVSFLLDLSRYPPGTYFVSARAVSGASSPTLSFTLLPPVTQTPEDGDPGILLTAVIVVAGLAVLVAVGLKVMGGKAAAESRSGVRGDAKPDVRLEVQRGMEVEGMSSEKAGIRLDVEGGIETPDETIKGGSG